jgi:NAD+ kinase
MKIKAVFNKKDERQHLYIKYLKRTFPEIFDEKNPDMYYVIGGDGSMHNAHKKYGMDSAVKSIPFFGKGFGTLNFIMNNYDNDFEVLDGLLHDTIVPEIVETSKIEVIIEKTNGKIIQKRAINDVIIGNNVMDWHEFVINSEKKSFNNLTLKGMGICLSTPLGSTAFNLNNGGNVLPLDSNLWNITDIVCNHNVSDIMTPQEVDITINSNRHRPTVYIDGATTAIKLEKGYKVKVRNIEDKFKLAFLDPEQFYSKRMKLIQKKR